MKNFVQQGDVLTVTASAGGVMSGDLIGAATSPVLHPIDTAMKATGILAAKLDRVAVVAAGD
jgi:predicted RecA/RadA family phage recombinase